MNYMTGDADVDTCEYGERLHAAILVKGVVGSCRHSADESLDSWYHQMDGLLQVMLRSIND